MVKFMNGYKNSSETLNAEVDNFENVDWVNPSVDWVKEVKLSIKCPVLSNDLVWMFGESLY